MVAMDTEESREQLWHRLSSESARAYEAYKVYMYLSPAERTVVGSWRLWSHNTDTKREPPFFRSWYHSHAWSERARPHDHHIELLREEGQEEAIKEEAARQAQKVEKTRARLNELRAMAYERAIECLESDDFVEQLRPSDVRQILNIHLETTQKLGGGRQALRMVQLSWIGQRMSNESLITSWARSRPGKVKRNLPQARRTAK
jgi:hypothetical protein